ncbi:MAG: hypothetical protein ACJZ44_01600 [Nitrospinales bacterium]
MNQEQVAIFSILTGILALFAWGRIRYDVVAFMGLILCVLLGLVPVQDAFSGFSPPPIRQRLPLRWYLSSAGALRILAWWT